MHPKEVRGKELRELGRRGVHHVMDASECWSIKDKGTPKCGGWKPTRGSAPTESG